MTSLIHKIKMTQLYRIFTQYLFYFWDFNLIARHNINTPCLLVAFHDWSSQLVTHILIKNSIVWWSFNNNLFSIDGSKNLPSMIIISLRTIGLYRSVQFRIISFFVLSMRTSSVSLPYIARPTITANCPLGSGESRSFQLVIHLSIISCSVFWSSNIFCFTTRSWSSIKTMHVNRWAMSSYEIQNSGFSLSLLVHSKAHLFVPR